MLFGRAPLSLARQHLKCADEPFSGLGRFDDIINVSQRCRCIGVGCHLTVFRSLLFPLCLMIFSGVDFLAKDNIGRAVRPHDRNFRRGPGEHHVGTQMTGAHGNICAAIRLAQDQRHFGHRGFAIRKEHLRSMPDDAAVLLGGTGQEAGHIYQGQQGDIEAVASADESRRLVRSVDVHTARQLLRLVGDDAHAPSVQPDKACEHIFGEVGLVLQEYPVVRQRTNGPADIVGLVGAFGDEIIELGIFAVGIVRHRRAGRIFQVILRQIAQQLADMRKAVRLRLVIEVLDELDSGHYGTILRAKGIVPDADGGWLEFDYVPGEFEVRAGSADYTGRLCVIGAQLDEAGLARLFGV